MNPQECSLSRRGLLAKGGAAGLAALAVPSVLPRYAFAADTSGSQRPAGSVIVLFLRGAVDGLSLVVPHQDKAYYRARPTLAIPEKNVVDLDGHFGLHPALAGLLPLWKRRDLAIVQATGMITTAGFSHFDAQAIMEAGTEDTGIGSGWLARHLLCRPQAIDSLRAVSIGQHVAASLVGWRRTSAMDGLAGFQLGDVPAAYDRVMLALDKLYSARGLPATQAAQCWVTPLKARAMCSHSAETEAVARRLPARRYQ